MKKIILPPEYRQRLLERFLAYVQMDTQSIDDESQDHISLPKQRAFGAQLAMELTGNGCTNVFQHDCGYVFATVPASSDNLNVPVIGLLAHMDTYHGTPGANVKPIVCENYPGGEIQRPNGKPLSPANAHGLEQYIGTTIITSDGPTLLGADDKAGVAEIMTVADYLFDHPEIKHGEIRICFTTNEEVGRGTEHFAKDPTLLKYLGVAYAYTLDGGEEGELEDETFSADSATITITGKDCHPGKALEGEMVNAVRVGAYLIEKLDKSFLPETTKDRQPFLHPMSCKGDVSETTISLLVRAFNMQELKEREDHLRDVVDSAREAFPGAEIDLKFQETYRNMKEVLDRHPEVMANALEALNRQGITPRLVPIRGGTDGSKLSAMGLPTPNLFAGGRNMHSVYEWVPERDMVSAVETAIQIAVVYYERATHTAS